MRTTLIATFGWLACAGACARPAEPSEAPGPALTTAPAATPSPSTAPALPARPDVVRVFDEAGRPAIELEKVAEDVWVLRDFTGSAFGLLQATRDRVVVGDRQGEPIVVARDGERGPAVYDGSGAAAAFLKEERGALRVLGPDGSELALVVDGRVLRGGAPATTTVRVEGLGPVAAQLFTLTELDVPTRLAIVGWVGLRPVTP